MGYGVWCVGYGRWARVNGQPSRLGRTQQGGRAWLPKDGKVCPESTEFYFEMPLKCIYKRKLIAILARAWFANRDVLKSQLS